jgi:cytochrome c oxidase subunit 5a
MQGFDSFPEPKIVIAALEACKRVNDHSLAVRYLEALKWKAGKDAKVIYPWLIQEIRPTLDKLGISTPEELGYDKPELGLKSVFEMKGPNDY